MNTIDTTFVFIKTDSVVLPPYSTSLENEGQSKVIQTLCLIGFLLRLGDS